MKTKVVTVSTRLIWVRTKGKRCPKNLEKYGTVLSDEITHMIMGWFSRNGIDGTYHVEASIFPEE